MGSPARQALKADLLRWRTRRARLLSRDATDFGGILRDGEVDQIVELVKRAKQEVRRKKLAAAFVNSAFRIADLALTLAGKFAM